MAGEMLEERRTAGQVRRPKRRRPIRRLVRRHPIFTATVGIVGVGLLVFVLVWFQPQKLFLDKTVNESLPGVVQTAPAVPTPSAAPPGESPSAPGLQVLASGSLRSLEHGTTGRAIVLAGANGALILRLQDLDTSNGPDLRVYLSQIPASGDLHAYGERFIDLGPLKGNKGSQNYAIPRGTDLSKFESAVVWCRRFAVGFGVAPLVP